ncbi:hypothetical protein HO133_009880 [Letharia lupina]|uniref:Uncharacterized protein n=1 Tax=Letharia lupina TaxID=560253 RepID=A0A8H6CLZ4_9LECA|nr:uncharacterized protein HO133_009880 [Letharia lupina]KAF6225878.1 hypothetical protein HO133_009880 [Letharia lupina]
MPVQFQLGLELTNIVNPISQALSALGSLALVDAIKKSGSDFITEIKLANLIGRHRIDPVIKFHFREMVAKSDQSIISRYLDIIMESGSGPTVQEALKSPPLFSMVIQLSGLAFAHQEEPLANAIVDAIEKIVQESNGDLGIVPDYVSLLGTIRACQQQTAAFRWAYLYDAAEDKIHEALDGLNNQFSNTQFKDRSLPVAVLQGLLMWLQSLQSFPEHRLLHLRCDTGISTVVVWCHHILGLSLMITIKGAEIRFGDAPYNVVVEESQNQKASVSLMDPLDPQEPLFTLQNDENSTGTSYEHRAEAYGYGAKYLQNAKLSSQEVQRGAQWVISHSVKICGAPPASNFDAHVFNPRYIDEDRLLTAGRFLFALDQVITAPSDNSADMGEDIPAWQGLMTNFQWLALVSIVITFARIREDDLVKCKEMPLALDKLPMLPTELVRRFERKDPEVFIDLLGSFDILSYLLLDRRMGNDAYVKPAVLLSAWGWSIFLDSMDSDDPFDVPVDTLRVLRGVPSRRGFRRTRIIDGPQSILMLPDLQSLSNSSLRVYSPPGVSRAEKGVTLVGHLADAFQVTQQFTYHHLHGPPTYTYGFRKMTEWSVRSSRLSPCQCDKPKSEYFTLTPKHTASSASKIALIDKLFELKDSPVDRATPPDATNNPSQFSDLERVFATKDRKRYFVYVSDNPAARWLQLDTLYSHCGPENLVGGATDYYVALGGQNTCPECAVRKSELLPPNVVCLL